MIPKTFRFGALFCAFLAIAIALRVLHAENSPAIRGEKVDVSVIAALSHRGLTKPRVVAHIDLTEPFKTTTQWTFVAVEDGGQPIPDFENHGPIFLCLVHGTSPDCALQMYKQVRTDMQWFDTPYHLFADTIVYANQNKSGPLLFLKVCGAVSGDGDCGIATALYGYDKDSDSFIRVFQNFTGRNNNQTTRFVESGPLQGDVIVNDPTENAPYTYWIEVYRAEDSGQYARILRYRSLTGYSDGNPLAVADSEMPEILRHLGFWHSGDPLPVPPHRPQGCHDLFLRRGEEWCK